jgi:hypothetical protein
MAEPIRVHREACDSAAKKSARKIDENLGERELFFIRELLFQVLPFLTKAHDKISIFSFITA